MNLRVNIIRAIDGVIENSSTLPPKTKQTLVKLKRSVETAIGIESK